MIKLIIPGIPPSLNDWPRNIYKLADLKKEWQKEVWLAAYQAKVKGKRIEKAKVRITYFFATNRRRDHDNYSPKFLCDGLIKAGVIVDDNADKIDLDWGFGKGIPERTEIEIWEV
jgi:crossover junction endodeoxyribonuclease RusA